jgi:hypothetical protein
MTQPANTAEPDDTTQDSTPMPQTGFLGQQPQFILRHEQTGDSAIRLGGHVHFLSIDHPNEPLYEVVAEPGNAAPAAVLAHLYDRDTDQLWQLRDMRSGRTVHSDLHLQGWRNAEEIAVAGPADALRLAGEFGRGAHESGVPPIPELDANYVTAVTLWPQITDDLKRDWLGSWFEASYHDPGLWEDVDWTTELDGSRYAGLPADQALTAAAADLEIAVKAALPRHLLPTLDSVRGFLRGEDLGGPEPELDSVRGVTRGVATGRQEPLTALDAALGPLTSPPASAPVPTATPQSRPAAELPGARLPHQQDQPRHAR